MPLRSVGVGFIMGNSMPPLVGMRKPLAPMSKTARDNDAMNGIQFVADQKGRKVVVQIDLKKHGAVLQDFWDGLISESRRKEKGIPLEKIKADLVERGCVDDAAAF